MDPIRRVARQHLQSSRLLGVDFVPVRTIDADTARFKAGKGQPIGAAEELASLKQHTAGALGSAEPAAFGVPFPAVVETALFSDSELGGRATPKSGDPARKSRALDDLRARHDAGCPHCTSATYHSRTVFGE